MTLRDMNNISIVCGLVVSAVGWSIYTEAGWAPTIALVVAAISMAMLLQPVVARGMSSPRWGPVVLLLMGPFYGVTCVTFVPAAFLLIFFYRIYQRLT